jgi:hypothetical protein
MRLSPSCDHRSHCWIIVYALGGHFVDEAGWAYPQMCAKVPFGRWLMTVVFQIVACVCCPNSTWSGENWLHHHCFTHMSLLESLLTELPARNLYDFSAFFMEDEFEVAELTQLSSTLPFPWLRKLELISSWTLWLAILGCGLILNVFPRELWICSLSDCQTSLILPSLFWLATSLPF